MTEEEEEGIEVESEMQSTEMSMVKHIALTAVIVGSGFAIAYFVDDLRVGKYSVYVKELDSLLMKLWYTSPCFCRVNRLDDDFVHPSRIALLAALSRPEQR
jgi:hypothetical protein